MGAFCRRMHGTNSRTQGDTDGETSTSDEREIQGKQDISIKLQKDREQALQRLNWQRGATIPNPEKIRKLEEE
ncbi:hypothetical protein BGZ96_002585 [Linnemannia gamsii]|uniref:Uncharacterized protein n=1 Tax=Linnemannia gamsii TaxID=64522 RepID=A0ABQ7JKP6_9FUNG|nr:hypothetical protein BGZ96_002585 [Linnemannia gamsii]